MTIAFTEPAPEPEPSLAYKLGLTGNIRWKTMSNGIQLTYTEDDEDRIKVWVAVKPRREVIEVTEPEYIPTTRFRGVFA